jgi:hypothetical protein
MNTEKNTNKKSGNELVSDSTLNIMLGAKVFSEKASDIFNTFLDKVKQSAEIAYEKGSQIYENLALSAQTYLERYKDRSEMNELKQKRDEVTSQLGYMCFMEYSGRYRFRVDFMKSDEFKKLMAQVRELDKQIIQIGNRMESEA